MSTTESTVARVIRIISEIPHCMGAEITATTSIESTGADSLDRIHLQLHLEDEFGIQIPDEVTMQWTSVQDIVDSIDSILQ